jgi:hypothetical protein
VTDFTNDSDTQPKTNAEVAGQCPVLVVGAGPTGLLLAAMLVCDLTGTTSQRSSATAFSSRPGPLDRWRGRCRFRICRRTNVN